MKPVMHNLSSHGLTRGSKIFSFWIPAFAGMTLAAFSIFLSLPPSASHASLTVGNSPVTSLTSGLVGYWTFDGQHTNWATGKTFDQSGKGNTGTMTSMTSSTVPVAGKFGQAFKFDGVNDYVNMGAPASLNITGTVSVSAWVKMKSSALNRMVAG